MPNLLNGLAVRPPWEVAGVDYAVGVTPGTVLKNPAVDQLPAGCDYEIDGGVPTVRVTGNNVVLNGWNFAGVNLYITAATNTTIENCTFEATGGSTAGIIYMDFLSSGLNLLNNVINGSGPTVTSPSILYAIGGGNFNIQYNYFENMSAQAISILGSANLNMKYNIFENGAEQNPNHLNFLQFAGTNATDTAVVEFNTVYQQVQAVGGEGFQFYNNGTGDTLASATVAYNTIIAGTTNPNATVRQSDHAYSVGNVITVPGVNAYFFCIGAGTSANTVPSAETTWTMSQYGVTFSDGTAQFVGNALSMSYLLHGSGAYATTTTLGTGSLYDNYIDASGAYGAIYPGSFPGWTVSSNVDMVTGKIVQANNSEIAATTVSGVVSSPASGTEVAGNTITFTVNFSGAVTVTGTPTLSLNDGGTATYKSGSGTTALTFSYTVGTSDSAISSLAITGVNYPSSATITDANGNAALLSNALVTFSRLRIGFL